MRISRPCYDKYHRCLGWAGTRSAAKVDLRWYFRHNFLARWR